MREILGVLALAAFAACVPVDFGGSTDEDPSSETRTTDKLSINGLMLRADLLAHLSGQPLSLDGAVKGARLNVGASGGLEQSEEGREVLRYVSVCALPEGSSLAIGDNEFPGLLGLAPEWASGPCGESCQRWVSACLMAHANATGQNVAISLRGNHPALSVSEGLSARFAIQEAAFYGNVFQATELDRPMFACIGDSLFSPTAGSGDQFFNGRLCGLGACPVRSMGPCWLDLTVAVPGVPIPAQGACEVNNGTTGYSRCDGSTLIPSLDDPLGFQQGPFYSEVITVYLQ